jgi:TonB family protein
MQSAVNAAERCNRDPRSLQPIMATHTIPPYDMESRVAMQGTVRLRLTIGSDGAVTDAVVDKSSGWERLDAASLAHVKAHWRWKPSRKGCAVTKVNVVWGLSDDPREHRNRIRP